MTTLAEWLDVRVPQERPKRTSHEVWRQVLLACGVAYAAFYVVANDVIAAALTPGYSRATQAISELSAVGAPAKPFLTATLLVFAVLLFGFGVGVWRSARGKRSLRVTGAALMVQSVASVLWLAAPMSQRQDLAAGGGTLQDTLHLVMSGLTAVFVFTQLGSSAAGLGKAFRVFAAIDALVIIAASIATSVLSARLTAGGETPGMGLIERVILGGWFVWMAVLAAALWRPVKPSVS